MKIHIMDRAKKKKFVSELAGFGLKRIPELLIRTGKERMRAFSGSLSRGETKTALQSERFAVRTASPARTPSAVRTLRCQTAENVRGKLV